MAHTIKLGTISKHEESTKQPNMTGWAEYSVVFKDGTDIVNPTITISADLGTVSACNYGYMLGRYYWVRGITSYRTGYVILDLETDVLATYKSQIGSTNLYILRSASAYNGNILDTYYPITADKTTDGQILDMDDIGLSDGCYIVNIIGSNTGTSTLYILSPTDFTYFVRQLLAEVNNYAGLDFSQAAVNAIYEPLQYIKSCMWLPVTAAEAKTAFGYTSGGVVHAGLWNSGVSADVLNSGAVPLRSYSITLPKHPQASSRGAYLNGAPFTEYIIDYEPFGVIQLDASRLVQDTTLGITIYVDAVTGTGILKAGGNNSGPVASITSQFGVPIPMSGASGNLTAVASFVGSLAGIAMGALTGNPLGIIGGVSSGISGMRGAGNAIASTTGASGSMAAFQTGKTFGAIFHKVADEDNTRNGRPYCKVAQPSSLSGFMIAQRGDVDIPGTLPEQQRIKMFLESGFFYE